VIPKVSARLKKVNFYREISVETSKKYLLKSLPFRKEFGYILSK